MMMDSDGTRQAGTSINSYWDPVKGNEKVFGLMICLARNGVYESRGNWLTGN